MPRMINVVDNYDADTISIITSEPYTVISARREDIPELSSIDDMNFPAVYILFDDDCSTMYVGQARSGAVKRIRQHNKDSNKDWFDNILVFTKYGSLDGDQLNYIEKKLIDLSSQTGAVIDNKTVGNNHHLTTHGRVQADNLIDKCIDLVDEFSLSLNCPVVPPLYSAFHHEDIVEMSIGDESDSHSGINQEPSPLQRYVQNFEQQPGLARNDTPTNDFDAVDPVVSNRNGTVQVRQSVIDKINMYAQSGRERARREGWM